LTTVHFRARLTAELHSNSQFENRTARFHPSYVRSLENDRGPNLILQVLAGFLAVQVASQPETPPDIHGEPTRFWQIENCFELPANLFPCGDKAGWWAKAIQLDLQAKQFLVCESTRSLRWHRTPRR
jgi:hypothetical protein